jgi:diamine N-acetyltransferase
MSEEVELRDVTARNWRAVARLKLAPGQEDLVADNLYSIAESKFDPTARPRAVYAAGRPVGFLMYDVSDAEGDADQREALIYRFMIDHRQQGKGYGRAALVHALDEIRAMPDVRKVSISYMPDNQVAKAFYASLGFVEAGVDEDGEMMAELAL